MKKLGAAFAVSGLMLSLTPPAHAGLLTGDVRVETLDGKPAVVVEVPADAPACTATLTVTAHGDYTITGVKDSPTARVLSTAGDETTIDLGTVVGGETRTVVLQGHGAANETVSLEARTDYLCVDGTALAGDTARGLFTPSGVAFRYNAPAPAYRGAAAVYATPDIIAGDATGATFSLKEPVEGVTVDPVSGAVNFAPTSTTPDAPVDVHVVLTDRDGHTTEATVSWTVLDIPANRTVRAVTRDGVTMYDYPAVESREDLPALPLNPEVGGVYAGTLPEGVNLDPATGAITVDEGVPLPRGTFTITYTDEANHSSPRSIAFAPPAVRTRRDAEPAAGENSPEYEAIRTKAVADLTPADIDALAEMDAPSVTAEQEVSNEAGAAPVTFNLRDLADGACGTAIPGDAGQPAVEVIAPAGLQGVTIDNCVVTIPPQPALSASDTFGVGSATPWTTDTHGIIVVTRQPSDTHPFDLRTSFVVPVRITAPEETNANTYNPSYPETEVAADYEATTVDPKDPDATSADASNGRFVVKGATFTLVDVPPALEGKVSVDSTTGRVTFAPGIAPGAYNTDGNVLTVRATYPDETSDLIPVPLRVTEAVVQDEQINYAVPSTTWGASRTITPTGKNGAAAPAKGTYTLGDTAPAWVRIDPKAGVLTVAPTVPVADDPHFAEADEYTITVPVTYTPTKGKPVTTQVAIPVRPIPLAQRYSAAPTLPKTVETCSPLTAGSWKLSPVTDEPVASADKAIASVSVTVGTGAAVEVPLANWTTPRMVISDVLPANATGTVPVQWEVVYRDGSRFAAESAVNVVPGKEATCKAVVERSTLTVVQGDEVVMPLQVTLEGSTEPSMLPAGAVVELAGQNVPNGLVSTNGGQITVTPGFDTEPGEYTYRVVKVTYPDKSVDTYPVETAPEVVVTVVHADDAQRYVPIVEGLTVEQAGRATSARPVYADPATTDRTGALPEGTRLTAAPGTPAWVTVDDKGTGLVATPGLAVATGTYQVPVDVVYPDGSRETVTVPVMVGVAKNSVQYQPVWVKTKVTQRDVKDVPAPTDAQGQPLPVGTRFGACEETPYWVRVAEDGSLTLAPSRADRPGVYSKVPICVTYPDGSTEVATANLKIVRQGLPDTRGFNSFVGTFDYRYNRNPKAAEPEATKVVEGEKVDEFGDPVDADGTAGGAQVKVIKKRVVRKDANGNIIDQPRTRVVKKVVKRPANASEESGKSGTLANTGVNGVVEVVAAGGMAVAAGMVLLTIARTRRKGEHEV